MMKNPDFKKSGLSNGASHTLTNSNIVGPSSSTPLDEIKDRFAQHNDLQVLSHCLGIETIHMKTSSDLSPGENISVSDQLAKHTVVVCIDTEHWTMNSDEMTEIGITVLHTQDVLPISQSGDFGDHGYNIMKQATFHFFRLSEKTHLPCSNLKSKGPEGNSFGHVRFVTFDQARTILQDLLVQPITDMYPLRGLTRPIILLGHSIGHDREHLNGKDLGFNLDTPGTVVRVIDTQHIAVDGKYWFRSKEPIGLRTLVQKLEFQHTNSHTAANDAARTFIAGVLMTLPKEARQRCRYSTQKIIYDLEKSSRDKFVPLGGVELYCCFCGEAGHTGDSACKKYGRALGCSECASRGLESESKSHVELHCPVVRDEVAAERLAWYAGQSREWKPKYPFTSRDRLQSFAPGAPKPKPATKEEILARRKWYDDQRGSGQPLKPFVWKGRSFAASCLSAQGPPPGQKKRKHRSIPTWSTFSSRIPLPPRPDGPLPRGNFAARPTYGYSVGYRAWNVPEQTPVARSGFVTGVAGSGHMGQQYSMQPAYMPSQGYFPPLGCSNDHLSDSNSGSLNDQTYSARSWGGEHYRH